VKLIHDIDLPLIMEGRTIGFIKIPAGEEVEVLSINGTNALIKRGDVNYTIDSASLHYSQLAETSPAKENRVGTPSPMATSAFSTAPIATHSTSAMAILHTKDSKTLDLTYVEPPVRYCPRFPDKTNNPIFAQLIEDWKMDLDNSKWAPRNYGVLGEDYGLYSLKKGGGIKCWFPMMDAIDCRSWAFALCSPQSPLRGNPILADRLVQVFDHVMENTWGKGAQLADFGFDYMLAHVFVMVDSAYPNLWNKNQKDRYRDLLLKNAEAILKELKSAKVLNGNSLDNFWINNYVRQMVCLWLTSNALGDCRYREIAEQILSLCSKSQLPDGGFSYVGYQNESPSYHGDNITALSWMWLLGGKEEARNLLIHSVPYYPLVMHTQGVPDWWTPTFNKQYGGPVVPGSSAYAKAMLSGDSINEGMAMSILRSPKDPPSCPAGWSRGSKAERLLEALLYRPILSKPLPSDWMLFDRNIVGPRGNFGYFIFSASQRDPSRFLAGTPKGPRETAGQMPSGLVGCAVVIPKESDERKKGAYALSAYMANPGIGVKTGDKEDTFQILDQQGGSTVGANFGSLGTRYYLKNGRSSSFLALPWKGTQLWFLDRQRVAGLVQLEAEEQQSTKGIEGTMTLVGGEETPAGKATQNLKACADGSWDYGRLHVAFSGSSFTKRESESGPMPRNYGVRLLLLNEPGNQKEEERIAPAGETHWFLVDVSHADSTPARCLKRLELPQGLLGFELVEEARTVRLVMNVSDKPVTYKDVVQSSSSIHLSADWRDRFRNFESHSAWTGAKETGGDVLPVTAGVVNQTIPPYAHVLVVISDNPEDHGANNKVYEDVF